jgi:hypothetical protein
MQKQTFNEKSERQFRYAKDLYVHIWRTNAKCPHDKTIRLSHS